MKFWKRKPQPPLIEMGGLILVSVSGREYPMRLSTVNFDIHDGASAVFVDLSHWLEINKVSGNEESA